MKLRGTVWKLGDDIGATDLVSAKYDKLGMSLQWAECAKHVLEDSIPDFVKSVKPGDLIVAGRNLGSGHAHYYMTAIMACREAGLGALLGNSVNVLFQRAGIDAGVAVLGYGGLHEFVANGEQLELDLATGVARNVTSGLTTRFAPVAPIIRDILTAGGSKNWALARVAHSTTGI